MNIVRTTNRDELEFVHQSLYSYNLSKTGDKRVDVSLDANVDYIGFVVKNDAGTVQGGIVFHLEEDCLYADFLWIADELRGQGAGAKIIECLKNEAPLLNRKVIRLFTTGFQAPAFYPKMGFTLTKETPGVYHYEYTVPEEK